MDGGPLLPSSTTTYNSAQFGNENRGVQVQGGSENTYNINYSAHAPQSSSPKPTIVIPFSKDKDFVPRGDILDRVAACLDSPGSRAALVGLGGVGKSQLAIEYAYRVRQAEPAMWVFWVHAGTPTRFAEGYRKIALQLQLLPSHESKVDALPIVEQWLADENNGPWVLIVDNCDEARYFFQDEDDHSAEAGERQTTEGGLMIADHIPQSGTGTVLFTSRTRDLAMRLIGGHKALIDVDVMSSMDAMSLLEKKLDVTSYGEQKQREELCNALDYFPLAITQAAAYINRLGRLIDIPRYIKLINKVASHAKRKHVLDGDAGDLRRHRDAKNSIVSTWQISFEHIRQTAPSAADLLSLMSFFNRQGIPKFVLRAAKMYQENEIRSPRKSSSSATSSLKRHSIRRFMLRAMEMYRERGRPSPRSFRSIETGYSLSSGDAANASCSIEKDPDIHALDIDIAILQDYSLITANMDGKTFEMHRLVQFATKRWLGLQSHGLLEQWRYTFIVLLNAHFYFLPQTGDQLKINRILLVHALEAEHDPPASEPQSQMQWVGLMHRTSCHLDTMERIAESERILCVAANTAKTLGTETMAYLELMRFWGIVLSKLGNQKAGESKFRYVLEVGGKLPMTPSLHNLLLYSNLDLVIVLNKQGKHHPADLIASNLLMSTQDRAPEELRYMYHRLAYSKYLRKDSILAKEYYLEELRICEQAGLDNLTLCHCLKMLAYVTYNLEQFVEAEMYALRARSGYLRVLGDDHPYMPDLLLVLGRTKEAQGHYEEARALHVDASDGLLKLHGPSAGSTVFAMKCLEKLNGKLQLQQLRDMEIGS